METQGVPNLVRLAPQTLGESDGIAGSLRAALDATTQRWRVEWLDRSSTRVRAECALGGSEWSKPASGPDDASGEVKPASEPPPNERDLPPGVLSCVSHLTGRAALRSGRRVVGTPPRFPSASLILCSAESDTWRDVGFADEAPELEIGAVALAVAPDYWLAAYLVRDSLGRSECRAVLLPREPAKPASDNWRRLPPYPQAPGMAGMMVGAHDGVLIAAGGANFPDLPPWEGGKKKMYNEIYALLPGAAAWISAGRLPARRAYGATVSIPDGVLVAGGEDGDQVFRDTLLLRWNGTKVEVSSGPPLPAPTTCAVAALLDGHVYLAGGYCHGAPRVSMDFFWQRNLTGPTATWEALPTWPGPTRALAVAAAVDGALYVISGIEICAVSGKEAPPVYLKDAYRFRPGAGWESLPDLPWSAIAAASPAPITKTPPRIFMLGGVDGRQVGNLPRATSLPNDILYFDVQRNAWRHWPEPFPQPVVCVSAVEAGADWIIPSGETMAGKRTTEVWVWKIRE